MTKTNWHITSKGEAALCYATKRACPLTDTKHFDNAHDAARYLTEQKVLSQEPWAETIPRPLTKRPRRRDTEATIKSFTEDSSHWSENGYMDEDDAWDAADVLAHREGVKPTGEIADALTEWTSQDGSEHKKAEALETLIRVLPLTMESLGHVDPVSDTEVKVEEYREKLTGYSKRRLADELFEIGKSIEEIEQGLPDQETADKRLPVALALKKMAEDELLRRSIRH